VASALAPSALRCDPGALPEGELILRAELDAARACPGSTALPGRADLGCTPWPCPDAFVTGLMFSQIVVRCATHLDGVSRLYEAVTHFMGRRSFIVLNRFFYGTTLGKREAAAEIPAAAQADPLPAILSRDEVKRVLTAVPDRKMRTLLTTVYAAGLRVSEVVGLQVGGNGIGRFAMPSPSPP
jgi:hypothetical protein